MSTIETSIDDPVKMVRAIRDKHYEETKGMTRQERDAYYQKKIDAFERRLEQATPDDCDFPFLQKPAPKT